MANAEHLSILKKGVKAWNKWRDCRPTPMPDLEAADLGGRNLSYAHLQGAKLYGADLSLAELHSTDFTGADLRSVKFEFFDPRSDVP